MFKKRTTGNLLAMSAVIVCVCFAMLLGTTFAWFTSTAETKVNAIVTGDLEVTITKPNGDAIDQTTGGLGFIMADGSEIQGQIYWEPGAAFLTAPFVVKNVGNYDVKYKMEFVSDTAAAAGTSTINLYSVLSFKLYKYDTTGNGQHTLISDTEFDLASGGISDQYVLEITMDENATSDYEKLTLNDLTIVVSATQKAAETDSYDNTYDQNATYGN